MTQALESPPTSGNGHGTELATINWRGAQLVVNQDSGQFSNLLDTAKFTHVYRLAELFASSQLVPAHFQNKIAECFIGIQMSLRLGVDPFMFLQNTYIVYGRPGMEAKLAIALINSSGLFQDSIDYEIEGEDPAAAGYRVRAFAVRKSTSKRVVGPWIDWKIVKAEKWDGKDGSKWKSIPGLMFQYRAATWFGRLHCPERLMGMQTMDELTDVGETHRVDASVVQPPRGTAALVNRLQETLPDTQLSDREANDLLEQQTAQARDTAPNATAPPAPEDDPAGAGQGGTEPEVREATAQEKFQAWKDQVFDAMKANKFTAPQAAAAWNRCILAAGCKGREVEFPEENRANVLGAARRGEGHFIKA